MQLYDLRYALENPGRLGVSARSVFFPANLAEVEYFRRQERSAFFKEVRQKLVEAGWWDL
jgi:hypothetical protein